jgi:hypothetical protein
MTLPWLGGRDRMLCLVADGFEVRPRWTCDVGNAHDELSGDAQNTRLSRLGFMQLQYVQDKIWGVGK